MSDDVDEALDTLRKILKPSELCLLAEIFRRRQDAGYGRVVVEWFHGHPDRIEEIDSHKLSQLGR